MRYLIRFSYDGTKFHGFQRQKGLRNVQSTLEELLSKHLKEHIVIKGAGRTDAGVHALDQCAHFDTNSQVTDKIIANINKELGTDLVINSCKEVDNLFHARHSVKEKTYVYKIINGPLEEKDVGYYLSVKKELDINLMKKACNIFVGTHDFHNFVSGLRDDFVSTIYSIKLTTLDNKIEIEFRGIGFYRYMVRHLVGAILDVGKKRVSIEDVKYLLEHPEIDKKLSVAKANGLYLTKIVY